MGSPCRCWPIPRSRARSSISRAIERSEIGAEADEAGHDLACRIAEAMIDLRRVRLAKLPLVTTLDADPCQIRAWVQLSRLDRYERRTFARRKRAIRAFAEVAVATIGKNLQNKANGETPMNSASAYFRLARPHPEGARAAGASRRMSGRHSGRPHVDKTNPTRKRE
jgi:hypothetical protein